MQDFHTVITFKIQVLFDAIAYIYDKMVLKFFINTIAKPYGKKLRVIRCSRSEWIKKNVYYSQNVNELTYFINFR